MTEDDKLCIGMICLAETLMRAIVKRSDSNKKRRYWAERALKCIEGIDTATPGTFPDDFINQADIFYKRIETEFLALMEQADGE